MDHVLLDIDPDVEDAFVGSGSHLVGVSARGGASVVPIEAKLRSLGVRILYEVCRVQKMTLQELSECFLALYFSFPSY